MRSTDYKSTLSELAVNTKEVYALPVPEADYIKYTNNMISKLIDISNLKIIKDDFIDFKNELTVDYEKGFLYDDMFLAKSNSIELYIDIGWTSIDDTFSSGCFKIFLIEGKEWDTPLIRLTARKKVDFISKLKLVLIFFKEYEKLNLHTAPDSADL